MNSDLMISSDDPGFKKYLLEVLAERGTIAALLVLKVQRGSPFGALWRELENIVGMPFTEICAKYPSQKIHSRLSKGNS